MSFPSLPPHVEAQVLLETELSEKLQKLGDRRRAILSELTMIESEAMELCHQCRLLDDPVEYDVLVDWSSFSKSKIVTSVKARERKPNRMSKLQRMLEEYQAQQQAQS